MKISAKDLKDIGNALDKRKPPRLNEELDRDMSLKEIIMALAPKLNRMKHRGFTTTDMVVALKESQININGRTLNRYLNEYIKASNGKANRRVTKAFSHSSHTDLTMATSDDFETLAETKDSLTFASFSDLK